MTTKSIEAFIEELNSTWQRGDFTALGNFYHENVVLLPPDAGEPIHGRAAVIESYKDFNEQATLSEFRITDLQAYPFGGTTSDPDSTIHMVHMRFEVEYQLDGQNYRDSGLEVYAVMSEREPQIIWRSQSVLDNRVTD